MYKCWVCGEMADDEHVLLCMSIKAMGEEMEAERIGRERLKKEREDEKKESAELKRENEGRRDRAYWPRNPNSFF